MSTQILVFTKYNVYSNIYKFVLLIIYLVSDSDTSNVLGGVGKKNLK